MASPRDLGGNCARPPVTIHVSGATCLPLYSPALTTLGPVVPSNTLSQGITSFSYPRDWYPAGSNSRRKGLVCLLVVWDTGGAPYKSVVVMGHSHYTQADEEEKEKIQSPAGFFPSPFYWNPSTRAGIAHLQDWSPFPGVCSSSK